MAEIKSVRYVFIDIVGFTKNRHVDAQATIIESLNMIVLEAIKTMGLSDPKDLCIKIPTGDGVCIAITDPAKPSDIHVTLALKILEMIEDNNKKQVDTMYQFTVRIAVNENDDFLVKDINGKKNVAGRGINFARRILDKADAGHILAGSITFEKLRQREDYWEQFRPFASKTKHGEPFDVFQYVPENHPGLATDIPLVFMPAMPPEPKTIDALLGCLMALIIQHEFFVRDFLPEHKYNQYALWVLLFYSATDANDARNAPPHDFPNPETWGAKTHTFKEQHDYYFKLHFSLQYDLYQYYVSRIRIYEFQDCFEIGRSNQILPIISKKGKGRLEAEQPEIWKEFSLDEPTEPVNASGSIAELLLQTPPPKAPEKTIE